MGALRLVPLAPCLLAFATLLSAPSSRAEPSSSLEEAWLARRLDVGEARRLLGRFQKAEMSTTSAHAAVGTARAAFWLGLLLERDGAASTERTAAFAETVAAARRATALDEKEPGGPFWEASGRAKLAEIRGIVASAWELPDLIDLMERVDALEPGYGHAATDRFWGTVITRTPTLLLHMKGSSLDEGLTFFDKSLARHPSFVGTRVLRAELLLRRGDDDEAKAELRRATMEKRSSDPVIEAWNRYYRDVAERKLKDLG